MLPNTDKKPLKMTIVILSTLFMTVSLEQIYFSTLQQGNILNLVFGAVLSILAVSLWQLKALAKSIAKLIIILALIVSIGGIFNPFFALDYEAIHQGESPDWLMMALAILPFVLASFWIFWVFDKYQSEFR